MSIDTPIIANTLCKRDDNQASHDGYLRLLSKLNDALTANSIYNVDYNDLRDGLKWRYEKALDILHSDFIALRDMGVSEIVYNNDISMFCDFNQAAGRIKRLSKLQPSKTEAIVLDVYIATLAEIDALNTAFKSLKPVIIKGRKPNQDKTPQQIADELKGTGICAICGRRQKIDGKDKMVHHGYQMSERYHAGYRIGSCFGVGYAPYELSNEANIKFAPVLANHKANIEHSLKYLNSGKITSVDVKKTKWEGKLVEYTVTYTSVENPVEFKREIESRISSHESQLRMINDDIKNNDAKIAGWTLQPLKYGRA